MKNITLYRFDELPEEMQHEVHKRAGYMENPWSDENWDTWRTFIKDVFPYVIKDWSYGYRHTWISFQDNDWVELHGEELRDHLKGVLDNLDECPTGYCADYDCYGYVRENLDKIVEQDMTAEDIARDVFYNFCNMVEEDDEYCQTFEYFAECAEANDWYYTADGQFVR